MTDEEIISVVTAHKEGKQIQFRSRKAITHWYDCDYPTWNFKKFSYRIKPNLNKKWVCRIEDEAIVINTGKEDILFDRLPGRVVLFSKLVDEHNDALNLNMMALTTAKPNPKEVSPRKPREWWVWIDGNNSIVVDYEPVNPAYIHVREVLE